MKNNLRMRLLRWLVRRMFKVPEGKVLPWYLVILHHMLFPLDWIRYSQNNRFHYDFDRDTFTVFGLKYAAAYFESFTLEPVGTLLKIVKRENGLITVEKISHLSAPAEGGSNADHK